MSISISFGPGAASHFGDSRLIANDAAEPYLSQTLVLGIFLAIFATQMAANVVQAVRLRRQTILEDTQAVETQQEQRMPADGQGEDDIQSTDRTRDNDADENPG